MASQAIGFFCFVCATVIAVMATYAKVDNHPQGTSEPDSRLAKQVFDLQRVVQAQSEEVQGMKAVVESKVEEVRDLRKVVQLQGQGMQELRAVVKAHREEIRGLTEVGKKHRRQLQDLRVTVKSQRDQLLAYSVMFEGSVVTNNYPRRVNSRNDTRNLSEILSNDQTVTDEQATKNKVETETSDIRDEQDTIQSTDEAAGVVTRGIQAAENVAFCSFLSHNLDNMGIGHTIKPDRTILNDGNAYNTQTGVFTVPVSGVYTLTFFIGEWVSADTTGVQLVVDSAPMVEATAHAANGHDNMGGNTVVLRVDAGKAIWLETYRWSDASLGSSDTNRFVTFSGYLLYQN